MNELKELYDTLLKEFGKQGWWPGDSDFEMIVGAVLTQNVSWNNVERAIDNLKEHDLLSPDKILDARDEILYDLVRPTGFYRQKTARLKRISRSILEEKDLDRLFGHEDLRDRLLDIKGIGPETADSIILYAAERPSFVVDAYTFRIMERIYGIQSSYTKIKKLFESTFENDVSKLQESHALIVELGKNYCLKNNPDCEGCPMSTQCDNFNRR